MDSREKKSLSSLVKIDKFDKTMKKIILNEQLSGEEKVYGLSCAIFFIKEYEKDKSKSLYIELAYYIILKYSLQYNDYKALYDFSINFGYYPIANVIIQQNLIEFNNISNYLTNRQLCNYQKGNIINTFEQFKVEEEILNSEDNEISFIAPTSYGKSSIITQIIARSNYKKIGIIVPTKSLINQTYRTIKNLNFNYKIIMYDDMYNNEEQFIGIFTQERALKLLERPDTYFDILFIDEAHNILEDDYRNILLTRLLKKNRVKNINQKVIYLSPLIENSKNLSIEKDQIISQYKIENNLKEPEIYEYRLSGEEYKYNRYLNQFYNMNNIRNQSIFDYILSKNHTKSFIFIKRPKLIEDFCKEFSSKIEHRIDNEEIYNLIDTLKKYVHKDFYLIDLIEKGIVYIHGKMPDIIKEYIEYKYKNISSIRYIVANHVILEGINLPLDSLFILSTNGLEKKSLINLIGRVNRLNDIFDRERNNLYKLVPQIYFVNSEKYNRNNSNMTNKIIQLRSNYVEDKIQNPILTEYDINKLGLKNSDKEKRKKKDIKIIQNEKVLFSPMDSEFEKVKYKFIESGLYEFYDNIDDTVQKIIENINLIKLAKVDWKNKDIMEKIQQLFISDFENIKDYEIKRLKEEETIKYYKFFLIENKKPLKEHISSQFKYFKSIQFNTQKNKFYIGSSYGEITKQTEDYQESQQKVYIDLANKDDKTLVNLSIVKIKMENDFLNYKLSKFLDFMLKIEIITEEEYNNFIYGTNDIKKLMLLKKGLSLNVINKLESDKQLQNIYSDNNNNLVGNDEYQKYVLTVDDFIRFQLKKYI